jgi:hypothetical protein
MDSERHLEQKPDTPQPEQPNILAPPGFGNHVEHLVLLEGQPLGDVDTRPGPHVEPPASSILGTRAQADIEHAPG